MPTILEGHRCDLETIELESNNKELLNFQNPEEKKSITRHRRNLFNEKKEKVKIEEVDFVDSTPAGSNRRSIYQNENSEQKASVSDINPLNPN